MTSKSNLILQLQPVQGNLYSTLLQCNNILIYYCVLPNTNTIVFVIKPMAIPRIYTYELHKYAYYYSAIQFVRFPFEQIIFQYTFTLHVSMFSFDGSLHIYLPNCLVLHKSYSFIYRRRPDERHLDKDPGCGNC